MISQEQYDTLKKSASNLLAKYEQLLKDKIVREKQMVIQQRTITDLEENLSLPMQEDEDGTHPKKFEEFRQHARKKISEYITKNTKLEAKLFRLQEKLSHSEEMREVIAESLAQAHQTIRELGRN